MADPKDTELDDAANAAENAADDQENHSGDEDFSAAFGERLSGSQAGDSSEDDDAANAAEESDEDGAGKTPAQTQAADAIADAAKKQGTATADPWDGLTPDQLKEKLNHYQHADASQRGRISSLTKKLNEFAAAPKPKVQAQAQDQNDADGNEVSPDIDDLQKRMDQVAEDYPEVAGPFMDAINGLRDQLATLGKQVAPIAEAKDEEELVQAHIDLEKAHPDYREIGADESYRGWISSQPESIQRLAQSYDAKEVGSVLSLFKLEREAAIANLGGKTSENNETNARRQRQLDGNKAVTQGSQPASSATPNDFEAAFKRRSKETMA